MKVNVKSLRRALEVASAVANASSIVPTMRYVSFEKEGNTLFIIGVGSELKSMTSLKIESTEDDVASFIVQIFDNAALNLMRQIQEDYIKIQYIGNIEKDEESNNVKLHFITDSIKIQLVGSSLTSCRSYFIENPEVSIKMGEGFKTKVEKTSHVVLSQARDPRSECLYIETSEEKDCIRITGIDGHRIAIRDDGVGDNPIHQLIILGHKLSKACTLLASPPTIEIPENSSFLQLRDDEGTVIVVPCLGGAYYNTNAFLEGYEEEIQIHVKKSELMKAVNITRLMEKNENKRVIDLSIISRSEIMLSSAGINGDANIHITCVVGADRSKNVDGFRITFNSKYFKEAVESFDEQDIILSLMTPLRFGFFHNESGNVREYILPLRPRLST